MVMGLASAADEIAELPNPTTQNDCATLTQYCSNCTFVNFTTIKYHKT
jgi:hypothetical protein